MSGGEIALRRDQSLAAGRREQNRGAHLLPEERQSCIDLRDIDQYARLESDVIVGLAIPA
jgi:hypothetical protein